MIFVLSLCLCLYVLSFIANTSLTFKIASYEAECFHHFKRTNNHCVCEKVHGCQVIEWSIEPSKCKDISSKYVGCF